MFGLLRLIHDEKVALVAVSKHVQAGVVWAPSYEIVQDSTSGWVKVLLIIYVSLEVESTSRLISERAQVLLNHFLLNFVVLLHVLAFVACFFIH